MIQTHELSLGALVFYQKLYWEVVSLNKYGILVVERNGVEVQLTNNDIDPIPITPEILEKAGFVRTYESKYRIRFDADELGHPEIGVELNITNGSITFRYNSETNAQCKFLHQLQNIYWCLAGKELEINL
ncbi:hypothetical protein VF04_35015 [Nostoc linckia z7]|uniref:Uncharacterized protein n=1 Tax=Nostoc linckia z7 TaxID=1628745 RepID=A0ABX4KJ15_NOSLI|nr:hypothetical protein [Nostoc linckia]PHJ53858.1 hypothetical protein VF02_37045 [Nostoc linckia z1]PHJ59274.1 hypothetical protein VF05_32290 [Nostoc linckia z3]PHJ63669.1 hypothetical protein VF03_30165 [Nostoc linckia z2]PHJ73869.1 hypothetical protein VF06_35725 [Nostoc linckia z4]PHJ87190.1 hypothetical protein VF04_35015 [Nostoc linckia z7]